MSSFRFFLADRDDDDAACGCVLMVVDNLRKVVVVFVAVKACTVTVLLLSSTCNNKHTIEHDVLIVAIMGIQQRELERHDDDLPVIVGLLDLIMVNERTFLLYYCFRAFKIDNAMI